MADANNPSPNTRLPSKGNSKDNKKRKREEPKDNNVEPEAKREKKMVFSHEFDGLPSITYAAILTEGGYYYVYTVVHVSNELANSFFTWLKELDDEVQSHLINLFMELTKHGQGYGPASVMKYFRDCPGCDTDGMLAAIEFIDTQSYPRQFLGSWSYQTSTATENTNNFAKVNTATVIRLLYL